MHVFRQSLYTEQSVCKHLLHLLHSPISSIDQSLQASIPGLFLMLFEVQLLSQAHTCKATWAQLGFSAK